MLPASFIITGCNVLLALSYAFKDKLYEFGLVHGIGRKAYRPFICGTAVVVALVWLGILAFWLYQINLSGI